MDADSDDGTTYARDACTRMKKCVRSTTGATARLSSTSMAFTISCTLLEDSSLITFWGRLHMTHNNPNNIVNVAACCIACR